jgi:hypothetical protein
VVPDQNHFDGLFAFQPIPLVLRPPNGEVTEDEGPADHEIPITQHLRLDPVLPVKPQSALQVTSPF